MTEATKRERQRPLRELRDEELQALLKLGSSSHLFSEDIATTLKSLWGLAIYEDAHRQALGARRES